MIRSESILSLVLLLHGIACLTSKNGIINEIHTKVARELESRFQQLEMKLDFILDNMMKNDTDELEERVQILELEMDNVENNIEILENEDSILGVRITDVERDIEDLQSNVTELINTDAALDDRIINLEEAVNAPWVACESSPCENEATCIDVNVDTFVCLCRDGFFGLTCSNSYGETAFLATIDADLISPVPDPIVFNETRNNSGGHYDNTTGIYTAPFDGLFLFTANVKSNSDTDYGFYLTVDGSSYAHTHQADTEGPGTLSATLSVSVPLTSGQLVWLTPWNLGAIYGTFSPMMHSWFAGYLITAD